MSSIGCRHLRRCPPDLLDEIRESYDPNWLKSYLAPCLWSERDRALKARHGLAAKELRRQMEGLLKRYGIRLIWEPRDDRR